MPMNIGISLTGSRCTTRLACEVLKQVQHDELQTQVAHILVLPMNIGISLTSSWCATRLACEVLKQVQHDK